MSISSSQSRWAKTCWFLSRNLAACVAVGRRVFAHDAEFRHLQPCEVGTEFRRGFGLRVHIADARRPRGGCFRRGGARRHRLPGRVQPWPATALQGSDSSESPLVQPPSFERRASFWQIPALPGGFTFQPPQDLRGGQVATIPDAQAIHSALLFASPIPSGPEGGEATPASSR